MVFMILGAVMIVISIIFRLASVFRLTIPLAYALIAPTLFHNWFQANLPLAEGIGYALLGLVALSWLMSLIRKIRDIRQRRREDWAAVEVFKYRVRRAKENGEDTVSTEGLWRD